MVTGKTRIEIIQGDSYSLQANVSATDLLLISSIKLCCKALNLEQTLSLSGTTFYFLLTSEQTSAFTEGQYTYDITIYLQDGVTTQVYNGAFVILPKNNKLV